MVSRSTRISTPRNPAATISCCNLSASPKLNADRISAACSLPTLRSTASAIAACQGQCSIERQTLITVRPRSANTRCISETAAALLGMNCKPCWQRTQSKAASVNGMSVALPNRHSTAAAVSPEARLARACPRLDRSRQPVLQNRSCWLRVGSQRQCRMRRPARDRPV